MIWVLFAPVHPSPLLAWWPLHVGLIFAFCRRCLLRAARKDGHRQLPSCSNSRAQKKRVLLPPTSVEEISESDLFLVISPAPNPALWPEDELIGLRPMPTNPCSEGGAEWGSGKSYSTRTTRDDRWKVPQRERSWTDSQHTHLWHKVIFRIVKSPRTSLPLKS